MKELLNEIYSESKQEIVKQSEINNYNIVYSVLELLFIGFTKVMPYVSLIFALVYLFLTVRYL
jgi:hypothetical protein